MTTTADRAGPTGRDDGDGRGGGPSRHDVRFTTQDSRVEAQIGVVHGDANFYRMEGNSPEEVFRVGFNYLDGNMPRKAEKLLCDAVMRGFSSNRSTYYWALAVLSNRSFDHLGEDEFEQLATASNEADRHEPDEWRAALDVVGMLVSSVTLQEQLSGEAGDFTLAFARYDELPPERREEIRRHLEMVLVGAIQDQLEIQDAALIARERMSRDRRRRLPLFFQPKPLPARKLPPPVPPPAQPHVLRAVGGAVAIAVVLWLAAGLIALSNPFLVVGAAVLVVAGAALLWRFELQRRLTKARFDREDARYARFAFGRSTWAGSDDDVSEDVQVGTKARSRFTAAVRDLVDLRFEQRQPDDPDQHERWSLDTAGIRATVAADIIAQYGGVTPTPRASAVDWLVSWHADRIRRVWGQGDLFAYRSRFTPTRDHVLGATGGFSAVVVGGLLLAVAMFRVNPWGAVPAVVALVVGAWFLGQGVMALHPRSVLAAEAAEDSRKRLAAENRAFADWKELLLRRRPTDAEMAAWLDYDKAHIKALAMKHYRLANRDLIAHITLVQAVPFAARARVLYGPMRYSRYDLQVFLLTAAGVRQFSLNVDAESGAMTSERRSAFRYEAVSMARVAEVGVRFGSSGREVVDAGDVDAEQAPSEGTKYIFAQALRLTLNNAESIAAVVENIDEGLIDRVLEDPSHLADLTRDTSGIGAALTILEAIAAEGKEWVEQERLRRGRRLLDYQRKRNGTPALTTGVPQQRTAPPEVPALPVGAPLRGPDHGRGGEPTERGEDDDVQDAEFW